MDLVELNVKLLSIKAYGGFYGSDDKCKTLDLCPRKYIEIQVSFAD